MSAKRKSQPKSGTLTSENTRKQAKESAMPAIKQRMVSFFMIYLANAVEFDLVTIKKQKDETYVIIPGPEISDAIKSEEAE